MTIWLFQVVSAIQGIAESDGCCAIEESSPEKSYVQNDEPVMSSSQGDLGKTTIIALRHTDKIRKQAILLTVIRKI